MPGSPFQDLGAPSDFSAAPTPASRPPVDDTAGDTSTGVSPEHVHFHADEQSCGICSYFSGGKCSYLKIQVPAEGGCIAFKGSDNTDPNADDDSDPAGAGDPDDDYGI